MAGGLHGSARTTPRVRAELQASQEATRALAAQYRLNPKTVQKWRKRTTTADQPMGPSRPRSTVLTEAEEAIVVELRRRTLLPLDDVLGCLRRRQRVLKGHSPERVVRERLRAAPARVNRHHDPPFDPGSLPKALQVITQAKDVSHPDSPDKAPPSSPIGCRSKRIGPSK